MANSLKIKYIDRAKLIPYVNNARTHSEAQVKQIAASIQEFGFTNPILIDEQQSVIAGHGRLMAAELLDLDTVPTIELKGLTEAQRKAYVIADNKLALNAGWEPEMLRLEITQLDDADFELSLLGFDSYELDGVLGAFEPSSETEQGRLDRPIQLAECPQCGETFDPHVKA